MTTVTLHSRPHSPNGDFSATLRAEWTKFRTVRGWVAGMALMAGLLVLFAYLTANGMHSGTCTAGSGGAPACATGHPYVPIGPGGEAVADSYYLVSKQLTGEGTLTARVGSLSGVTSSGPANAAPSIGDTRPGLPAWSKAGIIVTASTRQGAPYAAVMATRGHGVRFQYDYTHDSPGMPGPVSAGSPRWLRLTRSGQTLTAYESNDGRHWQRIGVTTLKGLGASARIGLFATSPVTFGGLGLDGNRRLRARHAERRARRRPLARAGDRRGTDELLRHAGAAEAITPPAARSPCAARATFHAPSRPAATPRRASCCNHWWWRCS